MPRILTVDDDRSFRRSLCRTLSDLGFDLVEAEDGVEAAQKLAEGAFDLVITDLNMPRADGFAVIRSVQKSAPKTPVVMLTGANTVDCVAAIRGGATDFLMKPYNAAELEVVVKAALDTQKTERVTVRPQAALLGQSRPLQELLERAEAIARRDVPVLLEAEAGSGSEAFARLIHGLSSRGGEPFVHVGAREVDDDSLIAAAERAGRGTIFVDDVVMMTPALQATLMRIVERRRARVLVGSPNSLSELLENDLLEPALATLLGEVRLTIPPLRERPEDVPVLLRHFLEAANRRHGRHVGVADVTVGSLQAYRFPGNVSELESMIELLVRRSHTNFLDGEAFAEETITLDNVEATLVLHDGTRRNVSIVVSGGQSVETVLLGAEPFVYVEEAGTHRHYARAAIAMAMVARAPSTPDDLPRSSSRVFVRFLSGQSVEGELRWVRSAKRNWSADVLCDGSSIFVMHTAKSTCFVAKSHVAWVEELP